MRFPLIRNYHLFLKLKHSLILALVLSFSAFSQNNPWLPPFDMSHEYIDDVKEFDDGERSSSCNSSSTNLLSSSEDYLNNYGQYKFYLDHYDERPITTIMININIWQKDDGSENWQNTPEHIGRLNQIISWVNQIYGSNCETSNPLENPLVEDRSDTKVRFEINEIYFEQNTSFWQQSNQSADDALTAELALNHPERLNQLNIHITGGSGVSYAVFPIDWNNLNNDHFVVHFNNEANPAADFGMAVNLAHEFGHNLDLQHTYYSHHTCDENHVDYLDDVHGIDGVNSGCTHDYCGWSAQDPFDNNPSTTCTNNVMGASNSACYFSPKQIARMHRALALKSIRKYVKCESFDAPEIEITSNEVWDFDIKFYNPIIVKAGVTLTLQCKVVMSNDDNIFIEQGGKVHVQGGTVTNTCDMWKGFEVWGNTNENQFTFGAQGELLLTEGAIVEHAFNAVTTWRRNSYQESGGIVRAYNSTFRNCRRSIEFRAYRNIHPLNGNEVNNKGKFQSCSFEWDNQYRWADNTVKHHITMNQVKGVLVNDCEFNDARNTNTLSKMGCGIYTLDAGYNVVNSSFSSLKRGIKSGNGCMEFPVKVNNSIFNNNTVGIEMNSVNGVIATNNTFNISDVPTGIGDNGHIGIWMESSHGFRIEDNEVFNSNSSTSVAYAIQDAGPHQIQVYNNDAHGCLVGEYSLDKNRDGFFSSPYKPGLEFNCNNNFNNSFDLAFKETNYTEFDENSGARTRQGDIGRSSSNLFSPSPVQDGHVYVGQELETQSYEYFWENSSNKEPLEYSTNVDKDGNIEAPETCDSRISTYPVGVGISLQPNKLKNLKKKFIKERQRYLDATQDLEEIRDGGDKEERLLDIDNAQPENGILLYEDLDQYSPFLSEEVLKKASNCTQVLDYNLVYTLCTNNPEVTKRSEFHQFLRTKNNPFTEEQIENLRLITKPLNTQRGNKENKISKYRRNMAIYGNEIILHYKHDTTDVDVDSVKRYVTLLGEPLYRLENIALMSSEGDFIDAEALKTSTQQYLVNSESPYKEMYEPCLNFYSVILPHMSIENTIYNMNESTVSQLRTIAEGRKTPACYRSRNILNWLAEDELYKSRFILPSTTKSMVNHLNNTLEENVTQFALKPNPAQNWVEVNDVLNLKGQHGVKTLRIISSNGKQIQQVTWENNQPSKIINTSSLENGVYFIVLISNGKPLQTEKLVIKNNFNRTNFIMLRSVLIVRSFFS